MAKTIYKVGDEDWSGDVVPVPDSFMSEEWAKEPDDQLAQAQSLVPEEPVEAPSQADALAEPPASLWEAPEPVRKPTVIRGEPLGRVVVNGESGRQSAVLHEDPPDDHASPAQNRKLIYAFVGLVALIIIMAAIIFALNATEKSGAKASPESAADPTVATMLVAASPVQGIESGPTGLYWLPNRQPGSLTSGEYAA
jgi:hypothetical protein